MAAQQLRLAAEATAQHMLDMQQQQIRSWGHVVVNAVADKVQTEIKTLLSQCPELVELVNCGIGQSHVIHRISSEILAVQGNDCMDELITRMSTDTAEDLLIDILDKIDQVASPHVNRWIKGLDIYHQRTSSSVAPHLKARDTDHIPSLLNILDNRYYSESRPLFERVRSADYRPMREEDVKGVVTSYRKAMLTPKILELLVKTPFMPEREIQQNIQAFHERLRRGVFFWDLLEEDLHADLAGRMERQKGMEFRARVLSAQDGELLGFGTYLHAPNKPNKRHLKTVKTYLNRGVTNAPMRYSDLAIQEDLLQHAEKVELFQDIRCMTPLASDRLGALMFEEMGISNPNLQYITAYRLIGFDAQPEFDLWKQARQNEVPFPAVNHKSFSKFLAWSFYSIATDWNKKGPSREHSVVDENYELTPRWEVMLAVLKDAMRRSRDLWRAIQVQHGDLSVDEVPRGKWSI